jgi:orotate phosphoribosyltransferase
VKFGAFFLKKDRGNPDAVASPYYFDCRGETHPSKPAPVPAWLIDVIAGQMLGLYDDEAVDTFEGVAAVPHGATPYAETVARLLGVPLIRLTKRENEDGTTTAASSIEAIAVLARNQIFCADAVSVVDREQGGPARLAGMGVRLRSLFTFTALVGHFRVRENIDQATFDACNAYHRASASSSP